MIWSNYLKMGVRNIRKNMVTSSINILGLSVAISVAIATFIFVDFQYNMDRFHEKGDRIYQIASYDQESKSKSIWGKSPFLLGPSLVSDLSQVENYSRIKLGAAVIQREEALFNETLYYVDNDFFQMFDFEIAQGDRNALSNGEPIVIISSEFSKKYFGDERALGEELTIYLDNNKVQRFQVGAVLEEYPYNAYLKGDVYLPISTYENLDKSIKNDWSNNTNATFVLLKDGVEISSLDAYFGKYVELQNGTGDGWKIKEFRPVALYDLSTQAYLIKGALGVKSHPGAVISLMVLSLLLLLMACFNFMNISIAEASKRLKEIALRKAMGGLRHQVVKQFLVENMVKCMFSVAVGAILAYFLVLPGFNALVSYFDIQFRTNSPLSMTLFFVVILIVVGFLSGAYPAFYISKFQPVQILRGAVKFGGNSLFSKILLSLQLFITFQTVVACFVFVDQSKSLVSMDWGYDSSGVLSIQVNNSSEYEQLRNELMEHPKVVSVSGSNAHLGRRSISGYLDHLDKKFSIRSFGVSGDYGETMSLNITEGRFITDQQQDQETAVVVNETFAKRMGWLSSVGKTFSFGGVLRTVVGVVGDFRHGDFHSPIDPMIFYGIHDAETRYLSIRTTGNETDLREVDEYLKTTWRKVSSITPYRRVFQEDVFREFYEANDSNITITLFTSIVAIILGSLGIYGLLSFHVQRRLKEFGVRKVLGALPRTLIYLSLKTYLFIALAMFAIAAPLGFLGMNFFMKTIYHGTTESSIIPFFLALVLVLLSLGVAVLGQVSKAINVNPSSILSNEV